MIKGENGVTEVTANEKTTKSSIRVTIKTASWLDELNEPDEQITLQPELIATPLSCLHLL